MWPFPLTSQTDKLKRKWEIGLDSHHIMLIQLNDDFSLETPRIIPEHLTMSLLGHTLQIPPHSRTYSEEAVMWGTERPIGGVRTSELSPQTCPLASRRPCQAWKLNSSSFTKPSHPPHWSQWKI